jgi:hypothetical protein
MNRLDDPVPFFRFLKENGVLFTCSAFFGALFYYLSTLIKGTTEQLTIKNSTILNVTFSQQSPEVQKILNEISSLQIAAVVSFIILAIILISIILIALRYDIISKFFACLIGLLLLYSATYLFYDYKEGLYAVVVMALPIFYFITYLEIMDKAKEKCRRKPAYLGLIWYLALDCLLIIGFVLWSLIKEFQANPPSSLEMIYYL